MTPHDPRLALALCLGFALGCGAGNRERGESCNDSDACAIGLTCLDGACRAPCNVGTDCPGGTGCTGGLCMPLAAGTCGQAADCRTPPACRTTLGARCVQGSCEYNRAATPDCLDDLDPLGTPCSVDDTCRSGWCTNGRCCESRCNGVCANCSASGACVMPTDDSRCGSIDCDGLDTVCRNYTSYSNATGQRCASLGACVQANSEDCTLFQDASPDTICRSATLECDVPEECQSGVCPADGLRSMGAVCNPDPPTGEDDGRCDGGTPDCRRLAVMPFVSRYFLEEPSTGSDRVDFFGHLPLVASGSTGISRVQTSTGAGVAWTNEASSYLYCASLGTADFSQTQMLLTFEVVVTVSDSNMPDSTIMFMGPPSAGSHAKLGVKRVTTDPSGQVTFTGTFGDSTAVYTWVATIGPRTVVHLVFDGYQVATTNVMRLFVDGIEVARQSAGTVPSSIPLADTDIFCIGNDTVAGSGAFAGSLWYVGAYDEDMTETEIMDAAIRLSISDE